MQLRKLPNAVIQYFNPGKEYLLLLGIFESTKYFVVVIKQCICITDGINGAYRNDTNNSAL